MNLPLFRSSKTYGHDVGLSCCFRQWRAESHCRLLHGYALKVHIEFEATQLDETNWVVDFGSLGEIKETLKELFDHSLVLADDDPMLAELMRLEDLNLARIVVLPSVGCEAFAEYVFACVETWLQNNMMSYRVRVHHVTVSEHGANSASYYANV